MGVFGASRWKRCWDNIQSWRKVCRNQGLGDYRTGYHSIRTHSHLCLASFYFIAIRLLPKDQRCLSAALQSHVLLVPWPQETRPLLLLNWEINLDQSLGPEKGGTMIVWFGAHINPHVQAGESLTYSELHCPSPLMISRFSLGAYCSQNSNGN